MRKFLVVAALLVVFVASPAGAADRETEAGCPPLPRAGFRPDPERVHRTERAELLKRKAPVVARAADHFEDDHIDYAAGYNRSRYLVGISSLALTLLILYILGYRRARRIGDWAVRLAKGRWRAALLLTGIVVVVPVLATLPLRIARREIDREAELITNTGADYALDVIKGVGFQFSLTAIGALLFIWVARKLPRAWPAVVAVGAAGLTFLAVYVFPVVYEPAFNTFTPVGPRTRAVVEELARDQGVRINDVLIADASRRTKKLNAYVSGVGSTKRVAVYDNLLEPTIHCDVFKLVVAHELAHEKHRDVLNGTMLSMGGVVALVMLLQWLLSSAGVRERLGIADAGDPRVIPFLVFFIAITSFLAMPVVNGLTRLVEARADKTAIAATDDPRAAIKTEVEIARRNLSDLDPHPIIRWWFFDHPPTLERIQYARDYEWERARCPNGRATDTCPNARRKLP